MSGAYGGSLGGATSCEHRPHAHADAAMGHGDPEGRVWLGGAAPGATDLVVCQNMYDPYDSI